MHSPTLLPIVLFLLSSTPVIHGQFASSFSSYADWLDGVPTCAQDCIDEALGKIVDACGATPDSTAPEDLLCICTIDDIGISEAEQTEDIETAGSCISSTCSASQIEDTTDDFTNFSIWCIDIIETNLNSTSSSGGVSTGTSDTSGAPLPTRSSTDSTSGSSDSTDSSDTTDSSTDSGTDSSTDGNTDSNTDSSTTTPGSSTDSNTESSTTTTDSNDTGNGIALMPASTTSSIVCAAFVVLLSVAGFV